MGSGRNDNLAASEQAGMERKRSRPEKRNHSGHNHHKKVVNLASN